MDVDPKTHKLSLDVIESWRNQGKEKETLEKHGRQAQKALKNDVLMAVQGRQEARRGCQLPTTMVEELW